MQPQTPIWPSCRSSRSKFIAHVVVGSVAPQRDFRGHICTTLQHFSKVKVIWFESEHIRSSNLRNIRQLFFEISGCFERYRFRNQEISGCMEPYRFQNAKML